MTRFSDFAYVMRLSKGGIPHVFPSREQKVIFSIERDFLYRLRHHLFGNSMTKWRETVMVC
jgi:hypothetical protein